MGRKHGVRSLPGGWIWGNWREVEAAVLGDLVGEGKRVVTINVVWGCGGWGGTQILAEIARGGWGLVTVDGYENMRPDKEMESDWLLDFGWERVVGLAIVAPKSEYSKGKG